MNEKIKLPTQVWSCGGDDATVPRVRCRLNKPVMAGEINEISQRLEELLRILNVRECPACGKLQQQCKNLAGICTECWTYCDDLTERFDFGGLPDHEIARHWDRLSRELFEYLAEGRAADMWKRTGPPQFGVAAGIEATLGQERIGAAILATSSDRTGFRSYANMRWNCDLGGLTPAHGKHPKQGEHQEWRNFWSSGKGRCWVSFKNNETKEAA